MIDRLSSGIPGLDEMIQGGFIFPSVILVGGEPGTGKTTFTLQSLFNATEKGETGIYVTSISEPSWVVQKFLGEFSFYSQKAVDTGRIVFVDIGELVGAQMDGIQLMSKILGYVKENVEKYQPRRIVFDPITSIKNALENPSLYRKFLHDLMLYLKGEGCLAFITTEYSYDNIPKSVDSYMVDAIIVLSYTELENARKKYIEVLKMRGTNHMTGKRSLVITDQGLRVQPELR